MKTSIKFKEEARESMVRGINLLADCVSTTLGSNGNTVIINTNNNIHVTKDGVTVAKSVNSNDMFENTGIQLIKEVASKTCDDVGDGTTTSTILTAELINGINQLLKENPEYNKVHLKNEILKYAEQVKQYIKSKTIPVTNNEEIKNIATISANNDVVLGEMIADAFSKISNDGVVLVEESKNINTYTETTIGMQFERGFIANHFVTDFVKNECVLNKPYIFISDQKIDSPKQIINILEYCVKNSRSLLVIAEDYSHDFVEVMKSNKLQGLINICLIKAPLFGEYRKLLMTDLAVIADGEFINYDSGLKLTDAGITSLGECDKVIVKKDKTTIINGKGNKTVIEELVSSIREEIKSLEEDPSSNEYMIEFHKSRIAKLIGGIATIYVGGATESELKERKDRIDDAVAATKAAIEEGIVLGGGVTYAKAACEFNNSELPIGGQIVYNALFAPFIQLLENAGFDESYAESIIDDIIPEEFIGFNTKTGNLENMLESGIIDPSKVSRLAFENAISVAVLFLTSNCIIANESGLF